MTGAGDVDHVKIVPLDYPVQVYVNKVEPRGGAPVSEQARLDMLELERFLE